MRKTWATFSSTSSPGSTYVGSRGTLGHAVEQRHVDVAADAEGEDPAPVRVGLLDHLADLHLARVADRRQAVGEEEDDRQDPLGRLLAERLQQRVVDVRAARRLRG